MKKWEWFKIQFVKYYKKYKITIREEVTIKCIIKYSIYYINKITDDFIA